MFGEFPDKIESLRDISEVQVIVEHVEKEYQRVGFDPERYKVVVELKLRQLGISVAGGDGNAGLIGAAILYVNIHPMRASNSKYAVSISFFLIQAATVIQEGNAERVLATTWDDGALAVLENHRISDLEDYLGRMVEAFANDYLKVNDVNG